MINLRLDKLDHPSSCAFRGNMHKFKNIQIGSLVQANKPIRNPDIVYPDTSYVAVTDLSKLSPPFQYYDPNHPWKYKIDDQDLLIVVDFGCIPGIEFDTKLSISYFTFLLPKTGKKIHLNIMLFNYSNKKLIEHNMKEIMDLSEEQFFILFKLV